MSTKVGRNDPCPCGSGTKYKRCCLRREREERARLERLQRDQEAAAIAVGWLFEHHEDEVDDCLDDELFCWLGPADLDELVNSSRTIAQMIEINTREWLLADGGIAAGEPLIELVLGPDGPPLADTQRDYLRRLASSPLGLYEIVDVDPGSGLELRDLLGQEPNSRVHDVAASRSAETGTVIGARIVAGDPALLSGAVYPFPSHVVPSLRRDLKTELDTADEPHLERAIRALWIPDAWFQVLTAPPPVLRHAGTGDTLLLTTDHYEVRDWDRLAEVLEAQDDVHGNREEGWTRFEELDGGGRRSLAAINLGEGDRVEVFAMTRQLADESREWLEGLAGSAVRFHVREHTDPMHAWSERQERRGEPAPVDSGLGDLEPEERHEITEQVYRNIYRNWADTTVPLLGDTPRAIAATPEGRTEVAELLRSYERSERQAAREENRPPVDLDFLWREIGLERDEYV